MFPADLPTDLPSFQARFGTDEQCRDYLFERHLTCGEIALKSSRFFKA
jgi:hypothetical protein